MKRRIGTLVAVFAILTGTVFTGVALAANQAANLDQCANDPAPSPPIDGCNSNANQWVNGNLGASKSIYREGDSIAYRMRFSNIVTGSTVHTVVIEWDTTKQGKHAIDYLTTWNRTVANANPCLGVSGCTLTSPTSTRAIPVDGQVKNGPDGAPAGGDDVNPGPDGTPGTVDDAANCSTPNVPCTGVFTMWGATITNVSAITYPDGPGFSGDKTATLTISFTASAGNPVLAWGGHIATRQNWPGASAVNISGSPYHMRLIDLDGAGGNQDRSLSADAVIFPGSLTIVKHADVPSTTVFSFNGTDFTPNPFTLVDNSASTDPSKVSNQILTFGNKTVSEVNPLPGYKLDSITCTSDMRTPAVFTPSITAGGAGGSVSANVQEGENVTCQFNNVAQNATATIVKSVVSVKNPDNTDDADGKVDQPGDKINYSITYTNTGNVTLTGVTVVDDLVTLNCTWPGVTGTLTPTQAVTCTGTYTVTQADLDNNGGGDGDIDNEATGDSNQTAPIKDSEDVDIVRSATASIDKVVVSVLNPDDTADADGEVDEPGDQINYSITYTNTGTQTLTGVTVVDDLLATLTCTIDAAPATSPFTLAPGKAVVCTGTYTVTQDDLDDNGGGDGDIDNEATGDSTQTDPIKDSEDVPVDQDPSATIDKVVTSVLNPDDTIDDDGSADEAGDVINYTITYTNTGNVTLTGVTVTDALLGALTCTIDAAPATSPFELAPGEAVVCTGSYTVTQDDLDDNGGGDGDIDNTAKGDSEQTEEQEDSEDVPVLPAPALEIIKTADQSTFDEAGDIITYTITVENKGNTTLTNVTVTDPKVDDIDCDGTAGAPFNPTIASIAVGAAPVTCTASHEITQADVDAGFYSNTACADDGPGGADEDCDDETTTGEQDPALDVVKVDDYPDGQKYENVGDVVNYTITVTNTGNVTLTNVSVTDPNAANLDCDPDEDGLQTTGFTINVDEFITCTANHEITQADLDAGSYLNTACADDGDGGAEEDCGDVTTPGKNQPTIDTDDYLVPQDEVTIAGLFEPSTGDLYIELRIDEECGEDLTPAWSYTWADVQNGTFKTADLTGADAQDVTVSTDAVIRWCTSYSGDPNNAARPLSDRGEVVQVTFDPVLTGALGATVPLVAWFLWSQRKRRNEI